MDAARPAALPSSAYRSGLGCRRRRDRILLPLGEPTAGAGLDKTIIRRFVRRRVRKLEACYAKGLRIDPNLVGKVIVKFTIAPTGTVTGATATGLHAEKVEDCIAGVIAAVVFPKPTTGGSLPVAFPFIFITE